MTIVACGSLSRRRGSRTGCPGCGVVAVCRGRRTREPAQRAGCGPGHRGVAWRAWACGDPGCPVLVWGVCGGRCGGRSSRRWPCWSLTSPGSPEGGLPSGSTSTCGVTRRTTRRPRARRPGDGRGLPPRPARPPRAPRRRALHYPQHRPPRRRRPDRPAVGPADRVATPGRPERRVPDRLAVLPTGARRLHDTTWPPGRAIAHKNVQP